jgi:hypothetical protein
VPSYVPTNGLVGWWGFNGNAQDGSGNGNHGMVNGATLTSDRNGDTNSSYLFNNSHITVSAPNNLPYGNSNRSISLWFQVPQIPQSSNVMLFYGLAQANQGCGLSVNPNGIVFVSWIQNDIFFTTTIQVNTWHHLVMVYENNFSKLFIDGNLVQTLSGTNRNTTFGPLNFGFDGGTQYFLGKLDDIGIWNRPLSQQEISSLYNSQSCQVNVTSQPQNQSTLPNRHVTFSLTSSDSSSTYQWESNSGFGFQPLFNAGQYSGVNTSSLTVSNTSMQNNNQLFRCIVNTNACGRDTSDEVTLSVNAFSSSSSIPKRFNYQSVIRDTSGGLVTNRTIGLKVTLSRGSQLGDLYSETHQLTSNSNGLITSSIGGGTPVFGSMDSIDWSIGDVHIRTEVDVNGGTNYVALNTNQLLSVPYSLYSLNSGNSVPGPVGPQGPQGIQGVQGNDGAVGPPGQSVSSKPIFINPQVLFSFSGNSLNGGTSRIDTINFNYLLNQNVSSVILFYEYTPAAYGYPNAPVEFGASAQINSITYTYGGSNRMNYGQVILPISSSGEVYFGTSIISFGNFSLKIQGYYP